MAKAKQTNRLKPDEIIVNRIHLVRGQKVLLDYDLAMLYGVETKKLNQQVKRNIDRFPDEFMFRLTPKEWNSMRSQFVTSSSQEVSFQKVRKMRSQNATSSQKKRKSALTPYAFTEHGVAMAANILKSERAVKMSVAIVKTFIQLRKQILDYSELAEQVKALEFHVGDHDTQLVQICKALEKLLTEKVNQQNWKDRERIGF